MKAMVLNRKGGAEELTAAVIPKPSPKAGEVLVKVHATAVMPTELEWFPTFYAPDGQPRAFPIVLSHEFSGEVETVGEGVSGFSPWQEVYGLNDWFINGAQAEHCVVAASGLAPKPKTLDHPHAAVAPISALTAWQGLFERAKLVAGQRVLIQGGAGAVGSVAVQLAHAHGAKVYATTSKRNLEFVRGLGAVRVIDHGTEPFEEIARNMDVVFDTVGGAILERSWQVLKPEGVMVTVATGGKDHEDRRVKDAFLLVRADGAQLAQIGNEIDAGRLKIFVWEVFPLIEARNAFAQAVQNKTRGKIALRVT